jgi:hypothetical protein
MSCWTGCSLAGQLSVGTGLSFGRCVSERVVYSLEAPRRRHDTHKLHIVRDGKGENLLDGRFS